MESSGSTTCLCPETAARFRGVTPPIVTQDAFAPLAGTFATPAVVEGTMALRVLRALLMLVAILATAACSRGEPGQQGEQKLGDGSPPTELSFGRLRARPLRLPRMPPGTCRMKPELSPATANVPGRPGEAALGDGPVYVAFHGIPRLLDAFPAERAGLAPSTWRAGRTVWIGRPAYRGPVLVRGARADGRGRLGFGATAVPAWELRLPPGRWDERTRAFRRWRSSSREGWRFAVAHIRVRARGCYAVQIDGPPFSDVIVFSATLQP